MSIIPELASQLGRNDDRPNRILGGRIVEHRDLNGIREAVENLGNPDRRIQVDCLGVLEEVGKQAPELIAGYFVEFLELALGNGNRLVWQSLINIALIAELKADQIMFHQEQIIQLVEGGSVISRDNGIKILARAGSTSLEYSARTTPYLLKQLISCRPKSVPQYAESIFPAVNPPNQENFEVILKSRLPDLTPPQAKRVQKILRQLDAE